MGAKVDLIFGYAEHTPGQLVVRLKLGGIEFNHHRDAGTSEGSRAALTLATNARKSGFFWTGSKVDPADGVATPVELFMTDIRFEPYPEQARELVDRFRDQGFDVTATGGYLGGVVWTSAEIVAMDADEFYGHQRDEALYVEARKEARAARQEYADARLSAAARLEEHREALASSGNVFALRVARVKSNHADAHRRPIDEPEEFQPEPDEEVPASAFAMR